MQTIHDFIKQHKITATADYADRNPNMADDGTKMDHWRVVLRRPGAKMTTYFSMGVAHNGKEPEAADVLNCLALDSAGIENNKHDFDEWCSEYGYDTDSRKAHKTFKTCERQAERLFRFLGSQEAYESLLFDTESL